MLLEQFSTECRKPKTEAYPSLAYPIAASEERINSWTEAVLGLSCRGFDCLKAGRRRPN